MASQLSLRGKTLEAMVDKLQELPVLPAVIVRLMAKSPDSEGYFDEILSLAESDPPFSARVIRAANSAASSPAVPIVTLRDAVARLGARAIGELVTAMAVTRVFVPQTDGQRGLWIHSLRVASMAREIASLRGDSEIVPDQVYLAGLLHDLGRFVMFDESPEEIAAIDDAGWSTPEELVEAEIQACGFDHSELGWHACRLWGVPEAIGTTVRRHHEFHADGCAEGSDPRLKMATVVQMADIVEMRCSGEPALLSMDPEELEHLISASTTLERWEPPPVPASALSANLARILEAANGMIEGIGLSAATDA